MVVRAKARLGVQTLVAVILLTLVVATAAIAIYTWLSGVVSTSPAESQTLKERIRIDVVGVDQYTSGGTSYYNVTATVRNNGDVTVTIAGAYVVDPETENTIASNTTASVVTDLAPGSTATIEIKNIPTTDLESGKAYVVKIVTASGIEARSTFIVP
jgi:voltage-gated potassium channel Kch